MSHPLRLRILFCIGLTTLLLALCTSFLVTPQKASAADFNCWTPVPIVSYTGAVIGRVTKACNGSFATSYVESFLSPTTQMIAWVNKPYDMGTTTATSGTTHSSLSVYGGVGYSVCGVVANNSIGGSACTP